MNIKHRDPALLQLEAIILRALVRAKWSGEQIAGFISAQRRDGILSYNTPPHQIEIEEAIWKRATPAHVRTQCQIPEVERVIKQITYRWLCEKCNHPAGWDIEHVPCSNCGHERATMQPEETTTTNNTEK